MRKLLCLTIILAMAFYAVGAFAANHPLSRTNHPPIKYVPKTTGGSPVKQSGAIKYDPHSMQNWKSINKLSPAMQQRITAQQHAGVGNGTIDTIPYFNNYFLTGDGKNSLYVYSMVGHYPKAGGTTNVPSEIIPLTSELDFGGVPLYIFDPSGVFVPPADGVADANLFASGPTFDATTTYPGPPAQTGQFHDSYHRTQFRNVAAANWHTMLTTNSTGTLFGPFLWYQFLEYNSGQWALFCCDPYNGGNPFPAFDLGTISNNFAFILSYPLELPATTNNILPMIITDYLFGESGGGCCVGGFHAAQPGTFDPNGVLVWTWATWVPANPDQGVVNPFGPGGFGSDDMAFSHEIGEIFDDPFVQTNGTLVPAWIDGSVSFAQGNMENGDAIEAMAPADSIGTVALGGYNYHMQNLATLEWFSRNPLNGGIYSWPNEHTLSQFNMKPGCQTPFVCSWIYGQGAAGFFFGPPY